jgi:hypothetical protein
MAVVVNGGLDVRWPALCDLRSGPYASAPAALLAVPLSRRAAGLVLFVINGEGLDWYQFRNGTDDENLVKIFEIIYGTDGHVTVSDVGGEKQLDITNWNGAIDGSISIDGGITLIDNGATPGEGQLVLSGGILKIKIGGVVKNITS